MFDDRIKNGTYVWRVDNAREKHATAFTVCPRITVALLSPDLKYKVVRNYVTVNQTHRYV